MNGRILISLAAGMAAVFAVGLAIAGGSMPTPCLTMRVWLSTFPPIPRTACTVQGKPGFDAPCLTSSVSDAPCPWPFQSSSGSTDTTRIDPTQVVCDYWHKQQPFCWGEAQHGYFPCADCWQHAGENCNTEN